VLRSILSREILRVWNAFHRVAKRNPCRERTLNDLCRNGQAEIAADQLTGSEEAMIAEGRLAVKNAIGRLPALYQQVIELRFRDQASFVQIGAVLGCSAEGARSLCRRAIERIGVLIKVKAIET
jgi:RNA polymerase sigma factor (sigma-70 family)